MKRLFLLLAAGWGCVAIADQTDLPSFDLRGDARTLFESVGHAYGLECVFDPDYNAGEEIRFQMQQADYQTAFYALGEATRSFVVPLSAKSFLVANDTPEKRRTLEPFVSMTVDIPQATTPQELTEAITAVQQVMAIERLGIQTQGHRVVLRGPASKILPARKMLDGLMHYRPEVSIEMDLLEVSRNDMVVYGFELPPMVSIVNLDSLAKMGTRLAALGKGAFTGMFGVSIASALLVAQMQKASGHSLLHLEVRSSNNQAVTFHSGDRYPVVTSQYVGTTGTTNSNTGNSNGDGTTTTPQVFGSVPGPSGVAIADFNRDGIPDIAAASADGNSAAVMLGKTDGSFGDATLFAAGTAPAAIRTVDTNGDGFLDLITADSGSDTVSVLLGKGDGTFGDATKWSVGSHPVALAIADFNKDGFLDIATANSNGNSVSILLGRGDGTFEAAQSVAVGSQPHGLAAIDLNRDGTPDLAVVNFDSNDVSVLLATGDGGFRAAISYPTGKAPTAIAADDLNRDGLADLTVANSGDDTVMVFAGDGSGGLATGVAFPAGTGPADIAIVDSNLDGAKDVVVANPDDGTISLLLGLGNGSLQTPIAFHTGANPAAIAVMDLNRDGVADVVAANPSTDNFSLLLGSVAGGFHDPTGQTYTPTGGQTYAPPPAFTFEDLGLSLKATPHVHGTEEVALDLDAEFKILAGQGSGGLPIISNRKLVTQICVPNGEWAMIAGLLSTSDARTIVGLPIKAIPGTRQRNSDATEVLVLIRAHLLALPDDESDAPPIALGSETRPRGPL